MSALVFDEDLEELWEELLAYIEERRVVPVLGPSLVTVPVDGAEVPLATVLADRLADRLRIDRSALGPTPGLNEVASLFVSRGGRREEIYPKLRLILRDLAPGVPPVLSRLAEIEGFDLFVSLTFDSLMQDALNQLRFGGEARTLSLAFSTARAEDLPRDWDRESVPAVYQLLGRLSASPEYAVTDEDVLEFVTSLQSEIRRPQLLFDELRSKHLLVIGAAFPDWLARFFLRVAKDRQLSLARSEKEILVEPGAASDARLVSFVHSFSYGTRVLGQDPRAFVDELHRRWLAAGHGYAARPAPPDGAGGEAPLERPPARPAAEPAETREVMRPGSVFLSYAKEDLPHVLALKATLDQAGIAAWLDKERLEAGDLYDIKIRRFIKTCAVFVPVISRNTERRLEGYFRREWKLAAERAQGIAEHVPFILPVVVDDTPEYGAAVPEAFLDAQWTRLVGGRGDGEFEKRLAAIVADFQRREGSA